jgi:alkylation response protein AidB-like acyl-CoA dehydrogenase
LLVKSAHAALKVIYSEVIWRVVDRRMQILGGLGITDDMIVARLFRDIRPFRIYDGPSEVTAGRSPGACCGRAAPHPDDTTKVLIFALGRLVTAVTPSV